jgi:hypothetical protein
MNLNTKCSIRKMHVAAVAVFCSCAITPHAAAQEGALINTGNFSAGTDKPDNWGGLDKNTNTAVRAVRDTTEFKAGPASLRFETVKGNRLSLHAAS